MAERPEPPRRCDLTRGVVRVVVLSPRADRGRLALDALSGPRYVVSLANSLRDASERKLWAGVDVVLFDLERYEQESPTAALRWVMAAAPQARIIALARYDDERGALKARALSAREALFSDELTAARIQAAVEEAWRSTIEPPPSPGRSWDTQECRAIVASMLERRLEQA